MNKFFALIALFVITLPCFAGPNNAELKSYRALVLESSKTCVGYSPAISSDGDLAYYSGEEKYFLDDICIVYAGDDLGDNFEPTTWKIKYDGPETGGNQMAPDSQFETRDIDWSPDGKSLAFVGKGRRLYIADKLDGAKETANVRCVDTKISDADTACIKTPRWSPDGKKVAYIKSECANAPYEVCIFDISSGKETVLATDAFESFAWEQPWAPDGKYLVYASGKNVFSVTMSISGNAIGSASGFSFDTSKDADKSKEGCITIVSLDGKEIYKISNGQGGLRPSWSPKGNRIAFATPIEYSVKVPSGRSINGKTMVICISDTKGKYKKNIAVPAQPSTKEALAYDEAFVKALRKNFEAEFSSDLTTCQLKRLRSGEMTSKEMSDIAAAVVSKKTGVDIKNKSKKKIKMDKKHSEAVMELMKYCLESMSDVFLPRMQMFLIDIDFAWSPDGMNIAFSRTSPYGYGQLNVKNLQTGKIKTLFDKSNVSCFSWTNSGKSLITQSRRMIKYREGSYDNDDNSMVSGNPEIWILDPK